MLGIPLSVLVLIVSAAAGLAAPALVAAYHRFCVWCFKRTGVQLPDNAVVDAEIAAVLKALLPELLREAVARKLDPAALIAVVEAVIVKKGGAPLNAAVLQPFDPTVSGKG